MNHPLNNTRDRPLYAHVEVWLPRPHDENVFMTLGRVRRAMKEWGIDPAAISDFFIEATAGDYEELLATVRRWVTVNEPTAPILEGLEYDLDAEAGRGLVDRRHLLPRRFYVGPTIWSSRPETNRAKNSGDGRSSFHSTPRPFSDQRGGSRIGPCDWASGTPSTIHSAMRRPSSPRSRRSSSTTSSPDW